MAMKERVRRKQLIVPLMGLLTPVGLRQALGEFPVGHQPQAMADLPRGPSKQLDRHRVIPLLPLDMRLDCSLNPGGRIRSSQSKPHRTRRAASRKHSLIVKFPFTVGKEM